MNLRKTFLLVCMLLSYGVASAYDFSLTTDGQTLYFKIISEKNQTAEVTYKGGINDHNQAVYTGDIVIHAKVRHDGVVYNIVGISDKAFSGAAALEGITLPLGMKYVGDFAFEDCTSLSKVVFPGNAIKFGQGTFFRCTSLRDISLGSDWKEVNLSMFRWSEDLVSITIPAKVEKIQNMKSLKHLEQILVDVNNTRFTSIGGLLYNKDATVLYGCPRAYCGEVKVANETEVITPGAFIDCPGITKVDLPAGLVSMSFNEFSRMPALETIIFRSEIPVLTAETAQGRCMLLQVASPDVKIIVPKSALKVYKQNLEWAEGEYKEIGKDVPYTLRGEELVCEKQLKGVKKFNKYE